MSDLIPEWRVGSLVLTDYPFAMLANSTVDYGTPENVTELIQSVLADGDIEISDKAGNRSVTLPVFIEDADLAALAEAEALLEAECRKPRNAVYCDPGDGFAAPFLFDVFRGQLAFTRNDDYEMAGYRAYSLTFRSLPHSRSVTDQTLTLTPTTIGTARQKSYAFTVDGSARTEAALHVGSSNTLGNTLIYTRPEAQGMIPLQTYRDGGGTASVVASSNVSGYYTDISTGIAYTVPRTVVPDGTYKILARVATASGSGSTTLQSTVDTRIVSSSTKSTVQGTPVGTLTTAYSIVQVGRAFRLPGLTIADPTQGSYAIVIADAFGGVTVRLDEAWLVEIEKGTLTWPETSGTPTCKQVWVEPPTVTQPYRRILRGTNADQSDAYGADIFSRGQHRLEPGDNYAFCVTDADTTSVLAGTAAKRWFTHASS